MRMKQFLKNFIIFYLKHVLMI